MKNIKFLLRLCFPVLIIAGICSCSDKINDIKPINSEISYRSGTWKGKLHRAKIWTNSGRYCACENCFGICDFHWEDEENTDGTKITIKKQGSDTYIYLLESISHSEIEFIVDEEMNVFVDEGGISFVERTLLEGTYTFESAGFYTNPSGMPTTYGRVQVAIQ